MKSILNKLVYLLIISVTLFSCSNDEYDHVKVTPVNKLYSPDNNKAIVLEVSQTATAVFEWETAKAADNGLVLYEVVFDKADGDFSEPIYRVTSDNSGMVNQATIPHKTLNKVAELAGIAPAAAGDVKWTVMGGKGVDQVKANEERVVKITRLAGFADLPSELYIAGAGSETGDDLTNARQFKNIGSGEFEIYTKLEAGKNYFLKESKNDEGRQFSIVNKVINLDGESQITETGVYKIVLDFNIGAATFMRVDKFELWFAPHGKFLFELPYVGNGIFKAVDGDIEFKQEGWGRDERYKFKMTLINGTESVEDWYGSVNGDNSRPNADTPLSWYNLVSVSNDHWANCFKFADNIDNSKSDVIAHFQGEADYTHEVVFKSAK